MKRVWKAIMVLGALVGIGTIGYYVLEDMALLDALYMTVTTTSTVGFGEVHPLPCTGRAFLSARFCLELVQWRGLRRVWLRLS